MGVGHDALAFAGLDDESGPASPVNRFEAPRRFPRRRLDKANNLDNRFFRIGGDDCGGAKNGAKKKQILLFTVQEWKSISTWSRSLVGGGHLEIPPDRELSPSSQHGLTP